MNKHIKIIIVQIIFLVFVFGVLYLLYPRTNLSIEGNSINFNSINANVIIISENPDFSNPRYLDIENNLSISLKPGTYYWKSSNNYIEGLKHEFTIESEVGMKVDRKNESDLVNVGNVKINITKTKSGIMVGHIILEPNESEKISDEENEKYTGRQI